MNNSYLASIMVLSYNQEKYISQTIDSLLEQETSFAFEIVVGDDCSTDKTREILLTYQRQHPELLRLVPEAPNKGVVKNFNDTLKSCRGKYITICAGDDFWHNPFKLAVQVGFLEANPGYGLVHTDLNVYNESLGTTTENYNSKKQNNIPDGNVFEDLLTSRFFISALTVCFSKSLFDKYVSFDEFKREGFTYEDLPTWLELSRHTRFKYMKDSTATYRLIENSVSHPKDVQRKFDFMSEHYKIKMYFLRKYNAGEKLTEEFELIYHYRKFNLAYKVKNYTEANNSFEYLKQKNRATLKTRLKKMILDVPVLYKLVNKFKKMADLKLAETKV